MTSLQWRFINHAEVGEGWEYDQTQISFAFEMTPRMSLNCKLVPVQNREYELNGLMICRLVMGSLRRWWDDKQWRKKVKTKDLPLLNNSVLHSSDQGREVVACSFNMKWSARGQQIVQSVVVMTPESSALPSVYIALKESAVDPDDAKQIYILISSVLPKYSLRITRTRHY